MPGGRPFGRAGSDIQRDHSSASRAIHSAIG